MVQTLTITRLAFSLFVIHVFVILIILTCPKIAHFYFVVFDWMCECHCNESQKRKKKQKTKEFHMMTCIIHTEWDMGDVFRSIAVNVGGMPNRETVCVLPSPLVIPGPAPGGQSVLKRQIHHKLETKCCVFFLESVFFYAPAISLQSILCVRPGVVDECCCWCSFTRLLARSLTQCTQWVNVLVMKSEVRGGGQNIVIFVAPLEVLRRFQWCIRSLAEQGTGVPWN